VGNERGPNGAGTLIEVVFDAIAAHWTHRRLQSRIRALQADNVLLGALRAVEVRDWRFGDMWLSGEWHVLPGRVWLGSTTLGVESIDQVVRHGSSGEYMLGPGLDAVVLTLHGPRGIVELAMAASSEAWFREAVAARS